MDPTPSRRSYKTSRAFEACERFTRPLFRKQGFAEVRILTEWAEIVGASLARRCLPVKIAKAESGAGSVLHVRVESGFALELQYQEPQILERIAAYFGFRAVARLRMVQGPLPSLPTEDETTPRRAALPRESVQNTLQALGSSPLEERLRALGEAMTSA